MKLLNIKNFKKAKNGVVFDFFIFLNPKVYKKCKTFKAQTDGNDLINYPAIIYLTSVILWNRIFKIQDCRGGGALAPRCGGSPRAGPGVLDRLGQVPARHPDGQHGRDRQAGEFMQEILKSAVWKDLILFWRGRKVMSVWIYEYVILTSKRQKRYFIVHSGCWRCEISRIFQNSACGCWLFCTRQTYFCGSWKPRKSWNESLKKNLGDISEAEFINVQFCWGFWPSWEF